MPTERPTRGETVPERERVAQQLRAAIDAGDYPPGALLPSERQLVESFGRAAPAVREALAILGAEGRIKTITGKGSIVCAPPVPRHVIVFDPADPYRDLTAVGEPERSRGAADKRTAALLGCPPREFVHLMETHTIHSTGALVRARRTLPHLAYDGMTTYPDPMGEREPIIEALAKQHGPLTYEVRSGAAIPTTDDRASLGIEGLGAVTLYALAITRAPDGRGLLLEAVHVNASEVELITRQR